MSTSALERAIKIAGGQRALATACGVKQGHIWNWLNRDKKVPADLVIPVARATDYQVTPHQLRPDIYPNKTDAIPPGKSRALKAPTKTAVKAEHLNQTKAA